jgi:hypothetical protein
LPRLTIGLCPWPNLCNVPTATAIAIAAAAAAAAAAVTAAVRKLFGQVCCPEQEGAHEQGLDGKRREQERLEADSSRRQ